MKLKTLLILSMVLVFSVLLSGCSASAMSANSWAGLSADAETAYLANGSLVYAVDLKNGSQLWQYPADSADTKEAYFATPVLTDDGQLLIASAGTNHSLTSLDSVRGTVNWTFADAESAWLAAPTVVDETIYAPNTDGSLYALHLDGSLRWKKEIGGAMWAAPISDGEMLYITSLDHSLYAFDLSTQETAWSVSVKGAIPGGASIDEAGSLYLGSFGSNVARVDSASQSIVWDISVPGWVWDAPAIDGEMLYVGDLQGNFHAFNTSNGTEIFDALKLNAPVTGTPLVLEDFIVVGTEGSADETDPGKAYAIDREGAILWQQTITGKLYTAPVQGGDLILFAPMETDAVLVALDHDGRQVWQFIPEK